MTFRLSIWYSPNRKFFFTTVKWILSVNLQSKLAEKLKYKLNTVLPFLHNTFQFLKLCNTNTIQWNQNWNPSQWTHDSLQIRSSDCILRNKKSCDPDDWNPDLPFTLIYCSFFCSPKLCSVSGFYCTIMIIWFNT